MVKVYCTICCKRKRRDEGLLPAINRYEGSRIKLVYKKSKKDGVEFRILSGKFGLIKPNSRIPWYDKLLVKEDVSSMTGLVASQLDREKISEITFFYKNHPAWEPYISTIVRSCKQLGIKLDLQLIEGILI